MTSSVATSKTGTKSAILATLSTTVCFGGLVAVKDLNMTVEAGQVFGLIGPNGAGKTTIFNVLTGVYRPTSGDVHFEGQSIVGLPPMLLRGGDWPGRFKTFVSLASYPCWKMS
jgi:ABC-type branched-chain amino acid transport systems, ATPase component